MSMIVTNLINYYPSKIVLGSAIIGASAITEMAIHCIFNFKNRDFPNFSANLGGCVFYGLLTANLVPYTPVIGAIIFIAYSLLNGAKDDSYITSKAIHKTYDLIGQGIKGLCNRVWTYILEPIGKHILSPIINSIFDAVSYIFNNIVVPFTTFVGNLVGHILPYHSVWYGVAAVITLIGIFHIFKPL